MEIGQHLPTSWASGMAEHETQQNPGSANFVGGLSSGH
jgi:hypothetical protein